MTEEADNEDLRLDKILRDSSVRAEQALANRLDPGAILRRAGASSTRETDLEKVSTAEPMTYEDMIARYQQKVNQGSLAVNSEDVEPDSFGTQGVATLTRPEPGALGRRSSIHPPDDLSLLDSLPAASSDQPALTLRRIGQTLDLLDIRHLSDGDFSKLALWERYALMFAIEGPDDEILVVRCRPHGTAAPDLETVALRTVNEWNHARRFGKAYLGDPTARRQLPIFMEIQTSLRSGVTDSHLLELIDLAASVASTFVDYLHEQGLIR